MSEPVAVTHYNTARGRAAHAGHRCAHCQERCAATLASGVAYGARALFVLCKGCWSRCRWSQHRALEAAEAEGDETLRVEGVRVLESLRALDWEAA